MRSAVKLNKERDGKFFEEFRLRYFGIYKYLCVYI